MNSDKKAEYYVGLDMGTGALGCAVTDKNYNLLKVKGKDFWFVREYETAETQLERRKNRISKRRLQRHQVRIGLVRSYFADAVLSCDPLFYIRQDNSKYYQEDKNPRIISKNCLFAEQEYGDKEYYEEFPTIFHLRQALIKDENISEERYTRLLYLAIVNMFEHRGHFLLNATSSDINSDLVKDAGEVIINYIYDSTDEKLNDVTYEDLIDILADKTISRSDKKNQIISLFGLKKSSKSQNEFIKCLCGLDADGRIMFKLNEEEENGEKIKIAFQQVAYEDEKDEIESIVGRENYSVLEAMKSLYDYSQLQSILKGFEYLSDARVEMYNKHKDDLQLLKKVYKTNLSREKYDVMFRSREKGTYSAYCNSLNSSDSLAKEKKYRRNMKERGRKELYDNIKKDLKKIEGLEVEYILKEIELETFLPKQITGSNGVIPNQVHLKELKKILENAEKHVSFLKEKDDSGYTVSEKIVMLFSNNIPYYIGPVGSGSKTGWAEIKEEGQVLPWNIDEKIDIEKTSEEFINRLVRECTYISGEKVLPKQSLLYEKYCVLNEINNLQISGRRLVPELKKEIYNNLFLGIKLGKKVTRKTLATYLINKGLISDEAEISGIDKEIHSYLSSYAKMYAIFGEQLKEDDIRNVAEEIIYYGTIYGDSKNMFRKKLNKYIQDGVIDEVQAKRISGYKFKDWARLSKSILSLNGYDKNMAKNISLICAMWEYNLNFMELINSEDFTFKQELQGKKKNLEKALSEFQFEDLEEYYYSNSVKRMIWQTILSLKEITKIMGHDPKRIFIEMTRTDEEKGEKGRQSSRGKRLLKLYENIKAERLWATEINNANESGILNSKKMYLYYLQMGKDAYTGEEIDIEDLFDNNRYDIDHIYPRSLTDDNNIENNLVLVSKNINQYEKKNDYPLPERVRKNIKVQELWKMLHKQGFMNDEKYNRLTSNERLTKEQLAGFIERQLVETAQGTKGIADLLKNMLPETKIIYVKARNVSRFRTENGLLKSRLVNDFHHAKDAYLNIVVGNVYYTKFTQNPMNYIKNDIYSEGGEYSYNLYRMYTKDVIRNGEIAWKVGSNHIPGTIQLVKKVMCKNTPIITRLPFEQKGQLFNIQPKSKYEAKKENYVPVKAKDEKMSDVTKYGGYTSLNPAYFIFFEHGPEKKRKKCFETVHSYYLTQIKNDTDLLESLERKGYKNPKIIDNKIKKYSLIKLNGYFLYIIGMDSRKNIEFSNATSMCLSNKFVQYIHKLENANTIIGLCEKKKTIPILSEEITFADNMKLYRELTDKHLNSIYKNHPKSIGKYLKEGEKAFEFLTLEQQVKVLYNIVQYSSFQKGTFSLDIIGGPKEVGRIRISGNMTDAKELKLINYSVTGLYKNEVDLLR